MHDDDSFMLPDLSAVMRCGLLSNRHGDVVVLHDKPIRALLWVEIDTSDKTMVMIYEDGRSQNLGVDLEPNMINNLRSCKKLQVTYLSDREIRSIQKVPAILR